MLVFFLRLGLLAFASTYFATQATHTSRSLNRADPDAAMANRVPEQYGRLPLSFEPNRGQTDPRVAFLSRGAGYALFLLDRGEAVIALGGAALRLAPVGAQHTRAEGREPLPGIVNYLRGSDQTEWRTGISTYARVAYTDIYPAVDLVYYGNKRQLEYDFVVHPGGDPSAIVLEAEGADRLEVDEHGDLLLHVGHRTVRQKKPIVYQDIRGVRHERKGGYALSGSKRVVFDLGAYDPASPLVIDPVLAYSTFLGGAHNAGADDGATDIAVDAAGYAYVTGITESADFPATVGAFDTTLNGGQDRSSDVFVTKLAQDGATLAYSTFVGGRGGDSGSGIAVDLTGQVYVTGETNSRDFPTTAGAFDRSINGGADTADAFVMKLDAAGAALTFSTFLGGSLDDIAGGIAVDNAGQVYVVGGTNSTDFPTTLGAHDTNLNGGGTDPLAFDAFVTKLDASGTSLSYSTFLGGGEADSGSDIAVDAGGHAHVTGNTRSSDFPTTAGAYDSSFNLGDRDAFATKLDAVGATLLYSSFLGGTGPDDGEGIALDNSGNAYVTGSTGSPEFPTTAGAYDTSPNGDWDVFVTKLDPAGAALVYSTLIGGSVSDFGHHIVVDSARQAHVMGMTNGGFPTTPGAYDTSGNGQTDVFLTKLSAAGAALLYSTLLGGENRDQGRGLAVDQAGNAYIAGETSSSGYPTTANAYDSSPNGGLDAFVTKLNPTGSAPLEYSTYLGGNLRAGAFSTGYALAVDNAGSAYVAGQTTAPDFPTTLGAYDTSFDGSNDVFVTKLDPSGTALVYSTFLGGSGHQEAAGIAVDGTGHAYVAGRTGPDFPTTVGAYDTTPNGGDEVYVAKLDPSGAALTYSTFLGGPNTDIAVDVAVDASGQAYVTGYSGSDFPTTAGAYDTTFNGGDSDVFVAKLNAAGTMLVYSTFVGGIGQDVPHAIAVDGGGTAYVTGHTASPTFPTTAGAFDVTPNGRADAFVTKLDAAGATLVYSTFLGGTEGEDAEDIAVDAAGNAFVTGVTRSANFPTTIGAYDTAFNAADAFVTKFDASGATLAYSTFLGGSSRESGTAIAVDAVGNAYVTGTTISTDFPTTAGALDASWNFSRDAFVTKLDAAGAALLYSTFLGGIQSEIPYAIALDTAGSAYVTGDTSSLNTFPTTLNAYDTSPNGLSDGFVAKFSDVGPTRPRVLITANGTFGPLTLTSGDPLVIDVSFDAASAGVLDPAEVYVGVYTQYGLLWLNTASQTFLPTPTPVHTGPTSSFGPLRVVDLANAGALEFGPYLWFMVVDADSNGQPDFSFFDSVLTVVQ
jgi:hypothetical protein